MQIVKKEEDKSRNEKMVPKNSHPISKTMTTVPFKKNESSGPPSSIKKSFAAFGAPVHALNKTKVIEKKDDMFA